MRKIIVFVVCLSLHCFRVCAAVSFKSCSTDESALLAFRARITHDPHNILQNNWTQGTSFCNWIGITCSHRHHRVKALNLSDKSLKGTIAKEIGNLSFLVSLDVSYNNFQGHIPDELGSLTRLRGLYMQQNELSGQIPKSFRFLTRIQELILNDNDLSGPIPSAIFNISSFKVIDLISNFLDGTLPMDMCRNLPNLESLNISINILGGQLPASLSQCSELKFLDLESNDFTGSIPRKIGNLSKLEYLSLGENNFSGSIPHEIGNIKGLQHLILGGNSLTGMSDSSRREVSRAPQSSGAAPVQHERRRRPIVRYREGPGHPYRTFSPARRVRPACGCWRTYSYPDYVVLSLIEDSRRVEREGSTSQARIHDLRETIRAQAQRIRELETAVQEEQQRTDAYREQYQDLHGRLTRVVQHVRDRTGRLVDEGGLLVTHVLDEVRDMAQPAGPAQPGPVPPGAEEAPEEEPDRDVSSVGSVQLD